MNEHNETLDLSSDREYIRELLKQIAAFKLDTSSLENQAEEHEILLLIAGQTERIELNSSKVYHLGRFEQPDDCQIDLNPYDAVTHGVSRLHASLFTRGNHLYIIDNGSSNGTFVGDQPVRSDRPVRLSNGSHILLGHLGIQVLSA